MAKNTERIGEVNTMQNGLAAEIVDYRTCEDITVRFADGSLAPHKSYQAFKKGHIRHPGGISNRNSERIGEKRRMNNGLDAEIIKYRTSRDIDVRFPDGAVAEHKSYGSFKKGYIKYPGPETFRNADREGEKRVMHNGMEAEIIRYKGFEDIDVRFEDGTVVSETRYASFKLGKIRNPNFLRFKYVGKQMKMACGLTAEITDIADRNRVTVRFEDGSVRRRVSLKDFEAGEINPPQQRSIRGQRIIR